jgi:hypothetical protein
MCSEREFEFAIPDPGFTTVTSALVFDWTLLAGTVAWSLSPLKTVVDNVVPPK